MKGSMKHSRTITRLTVLLTACCVLTSAGGAGASSIRDDEVIIGGVLTGPCGLPGALGPTGSNDDFTNLSIAKGFAGIPTGGLTTAPGSAVFRNMIENVGVTDDTFVITVPTAPRNFAFEISTDDGANYVSIEPGTNGISLPVAYRAAAIFFVRITAPAGLKVFTGYDTVIRATSTNMPNATNETIDRLYTGFVQLKKTLTVTNNTGVGGPSEAVSGAEIEISITYSNISSTGGAGSSMLTARDIFVYENGKVAPNNWGYTTEHIVGASDTQGGIVKGDNSGSTSLSDLVASLPAGESGVFKFKRRIK